jgi:hypothetical protein
MDYAVAFDEANKALEKQIAKKVIRNNRNLFCPVCGEDAKQIVEKGFMTIR